MSPTERPEGALEKAREAVQGAKIARANFERHLNQMRLVRAFMEDSAEWIRNLRGNIYIFDPAREQEISNFTDGIGGRKVRDGIYLLPMGILFVSDSFGQRAEAAPAETEAVVEPGRHREEAVDRRGDPAHGAAATRPTPPDRAPEPTDPMAEALGLEPSPGGDFWTGGRPRSARRAAVGLLDTEADVMPSTGPFGASRDLRTGRSGRPAEPTREETELETIRPDLAEGKAVFERGEERKARERLHELHRVGLYAFLLVQGVRSRVSPSWKSVGRVRQIGRRRELCICQRVL